MLFDAEEIVFTFSEGTSVLHVTSCTISILISLNFTQIFPTTPFVILDIKLSRIKFYDEQKHVQLYLFRRRI